MRVVTVLLPLILIGGCDKQSGTDGQPAGNVAAPAPTAKVETTGTLDITQRGKPMPGERFQDPDGKTVTLAEFKGRPLLVNLWATWCGPCVAELPSLDRLAARAGDKLTVLAVSQDPQGNAVVAPWWAEHKLANLRPYLDPKTDLGFAYASGMLPTTILYDREGKEVWRIVGGMDWDGPRANTLLAGIIAPRTG